MLIITWNFSRLLRNKSSAAIFYYFVIIFFIGRMMSLDDWFLWVVLNFFFSFLNICFLCAFYEEESMMYFMTSIHRRFARVLPHLTWGHVRHRVENAKRDGPLEKLGTLPVPLKACKLHETGGVLWRILPISWPLWLDACD